MGSNRIKTKWDEYVETTYKTGRELGIKYMPGSQFCSHGYEAGKDCDICFAIWVKMKDTFIYEK